MGQRHVRRISQVFIDRLLDRVDLAEVVRGVVPLKQRGGRLWACCPFHDEKTPSFCVHPTEGFYKCFGCGEGGNAISFLMKTRGLSFVEAIEALADMARMDVVHDGDAAGPGAAADRSPGGWRHARAPAGGGAGSRHDAAPPERDLVPDFDDDAAMPWVDTTGAVSRRGPPADDVVAAPAGQGSRPDVAATGSGRTAAGASRVPAAAGVAGTGGSGGAPPARGDRAGAGDAVPPAGTASRRMPDGAGADAAGAVRRRQLDALVALLERAADFYARALQSPAGRDAARYLAGRGIGSAAIGSFGIGFAPGGFDVLRGAFGADALPQLEQAGLVVRRDESGASAGRGFFDRFRERVMFPIRDRRGRIVGFGGRAIGDVKPKYLNSPETALFHKGREVYGLHEARRARTRPQRLLLVEGYMDVVSLHQAGFTEAVAALGTASTPDQFRLLFRAVPEVVCCFDGDAAGRAAAWKALQTALPLLTDDRRLSFLFLPDGEDPDSLVRGAGGAAAFAALLAEAMPFADYFFAELTRGLALDGVDDRSLLAHRAQPLIAGLPPGTRATLLRDRLHELVRPRHGGRHGGMRPVRAPVQARVPPPVVRIVKWLARNPGLVAELDACWTPFAAAPGADFALLRRVVELIRAGGIQHTGELLGRLADDEAAYQRVTAFLGEYVIADEEAQRSELRGAIARAIEQIERRARRTGAADGADEEAAFLADWHRKQQTKGV
jgi:DNA primase